MNNDEAVLAELRKIAAWADTQRKMTRWSLILVGAFIPLLILFAVVMERRAAERLRDAEVGPANLTSERTANWYDVDQCVQQGEFKQAIQAAEMLASKSPNNPEAHRRLAGVYLAAGDIEKARSHFSEAVRLFPTEENEKLLQAAERRIWEEKHP